MSCQGCKEVLGLRTEQTDGTEFWLVVMNELKTWGSQDVLTTVLDGLKRFPEAIETVYALATVQTCIAHLIRYSLAHASYKKRRPPMRRWESAPEQTSPIIASCWRICSRRTSEVATSLDAGNRDPIAGCLFCSRKRLQETVLDYGVWPTRTYKIRIMPLTHADLPALPF